MKVDEGTTRRGLSALYESVLENLTLQVDGMTCASCVSHVEKALRAVPGVQNATVNLLTKTANVELANGSAPGALIVAVESAGYLATLNTADSSGLTATKPQTGTHNEGRTDLLIAVIGGIPLMVISMSPAIHSQPGQLATLVLSAVVTFVAGRGFFVRSLRALRHANANMDTLVALGAASAFGYSTYALMATPGGHAHSLYFETGAMIVTFVLLGRWLEERAKHRATDALTKIASLIPAQATVIRDGHETTIEAAALVVGDHVRVAAHARIPADGQLQSEFASIDEGVLTGESLPVEKRNGARVFAGSLNGQTAFEMIAQELGERSMLAGVARLVADAQAGKPAIQVLADKISAVFVPAIMTVALLTLLGWLAVGSGLEAGLLAAVSVLVVACPCALGLATPTAIVVASGRAAGFGAFLRKTDVLDRARAVTAVVLDKTGTLTRGTPKLVATHLLGQVTKEEVLSMAASVSRGSSHPLSSAIVEGAGDLTPRLSMQTVQVPGRGVSGEVQGVRVLVGSEAWIQEQLSLAAMPKLQVQPTSSVVWVAEGTGLIAALEIADELRPEARTLIDDLKARKLDIHIASGDRQEVVSAVGQALGLGDGKLHAGCTPAHKTDLIRSLQAQGQVVAMIGDGVNDAPALAAADVSLALGSGTDVAAATASVLLIKDGLRGLLALIDLSKKTTHVIHQNFAWAFGYNILLVPAAALGLLGAIGGPMLAAALMAISSITVVLNSLRLRRA